MFAKASSEDKANQMIAMMLGPAGHGKSKAIRAINLQNHGIVKVRLLLPRRVVLLLQISEVSLFII